MMGTSLLRLVWSFKQTGWDLGLFPVLFGRLGWFRNVRQVWPTVRATIRKLTRYSPRAVRTRVKRMRQFTSLFRECQ